MKQIGADLSALLADWWRQYIFLYLLATLSAVLEVASIALIFPLIQFAIDDTEQSLHLPALVQGIFRALHLEGNVMKVALLLLAVFISKNVLRFLADYGNARIMHNLRAAWMQKLLKKYLTSHYLFFVKSRQGTLIYNLFDLTNQVVYGLRQLVSIFMDGVSLLIVLVALVALSWKVTVLGLAILVTGWILAHRPLLSRASQLGIHQLNLHHEVNALAAESIRGIREIKTYGMVDRITAVYNKTTRRLANIQTRISFLQLLPSMFPEILLVLVLIILLYSLQRSGASLEFMLPIIATYTYALFRVFLNGSVAVRRSIATVNVWPQVNHLATSLSSESDLDVRGGNQLVPRTNASIVFEKVSCDLSGNRILTDVSFTVQPRKITAIIGASGGGKSSLANLLIRLLEPTSGQITYSQVPIHKLPLDEWRGLFGFVGQDPYIFNGTVKENIALGAPISLGDKDIRTAAAQAGALDFINDLPQKMDTLVGEHGGRLSGGQKQRIALARALIRSPRILLLDEATSAVDARTEVEIMATIKEISQSVTVLLITHRLKVATAADYVVVIEEGQVVEKGKPQELLQKRGQYFHLLNIQ